MSPGASKRHNRLARILANALDAAGGADWNADTDFDVRLQDVPLTKRRPDVVVYRADSIDVSTTRPEHVLLIVEIPVIYSYLLDPASGRYRDGEVFTGLVKASVPFTVEIDLSGHW